MLLRSKALFILLIGLSIILTGVQSSASEVSFKGKTVKMLVNFGVGSTTEARARQLAPFVARHLPGKPKMIVEAKGGGRGTLAAAHMYKNVAPDGMTMGVMGILVFRHNTGYKIPVDINDFVPIGAVGGSGVVIGRSDAGFKTYKDLVKPGNELIIAAMTPAAPGVFPIRLLLEGLNLTDKTKFLYGYKGQLKFLQALLADEVTLTFLGASQYMPRQSGFKKEGKVVGLLEYGYPKADGSGWLPTPGLNRPLMKDVWHELDPNSVKGPYFKTFQFLLKEAPLRFLYVLPPNTPQNYAEAWDKAIENASKDPDYLAMINKSGANMPVHTNGRDAKTLMLQMDKEKNDPEIQSVLKKLKKK
jgi:tripartite-type tricarboxylate transporter receptor subunit TctC